MPSNFKEALGNQISLLPAVTEQRTWTPGSKNMCLIVGKYSQKKKTLIVPTCENIVLSKSLEPSLPYLYFARKWERSVAIYSSTQPGRSSRNPYNFLKQPSGIVFQASWRKIKALLWMLAPLCSVVSHKTIPPCFNHVEVQVLAKPIHDCPGTLLLDGQSVRDNCHPEKWSCCHWS